MSSLIFFFASLLAAASVSNAQITCSAGTVKIDGTVQWVRKDSFVNPASFHSTVPYTRRITSTITTSRAEVERALRSTSTTASLTYSVNVGVDIKIFSASAGYEFTWASTAVSEIMRQTTDTHTKQMSTQRTIGPIEIMPGQSVYVFEKKLRFPSLSWETTEMTTRHTSTIAPSDEKVSMCVPVNRQRFMSDIKVHIYKAHWHSEKFMQVKRGISGSDVDESGQNWGDVNRGYGGDYVYLEPTWTTNAVDAADRVEVVIADGWLQWVRDRGQKDLASGAGGKYRFLDVWHRRTAYKSKIVDIVLWEGKLQAVPDGWTGMSGDLNKGRGGRFLYLVWKSVKAL